ncbi:uncharacterized protein LOC135712269 [Ochlerotatus camptorhynchus]|uniref:uncharacterized protein LOC135712269 n=1 Tax=Ochlerotatus camptorhynchus TaxID=644619 RepID=UPI0031D87DAE
MTFPEDLQGLMDGSVVPTKRQVLSLVMSVFDPLGMIAPFVVHGRPIVQEAWRSGIGWDEPLPADILPRWEKYVKLLGTLDMVKIPRCYFPGYSAGAYDSLELHVFVDASSTAYAAAAYFRIVDGGKIRCSLVSAKPKVAPIKLLSVPRLELQAAVIGTRLMKSTVLNWLRSDPRKYKQYVAFRVTEILDETEVSDWKKVPTRMNVADEATKWGHGPCFEEQSRWFKAPEFLYKPECSWPEEAVESTTAEELRMVHVHQLPPTQLVIEFKRFSKWERLTRTVAFVLRFGCRQKGKDVTLSSEECKLAESTVFKPIQASEYPDECKILRKNHQVQLEQRKQNQQSSRIFKLSPFIDPTGVK